jgi:hypothetical protein
MKSKKYFVWSFCILALIIIMPIYQSTIYDNSENYTVNNENTKHQISCRGKISLIHGEKTMLPFYKIGLYLGMEQMTIHFEIIDSISINDDDITIETPCQIEFSQCRGYGTPGIIILLQSIMSPDGLSSFTLECTCDDYQIITE